MSMQSEGKDAKGRNYDQVTKDGSSSAGTLGSGGTGDVDRNMQRSDSQQQARTDDLLSPNADSSERQGFTPSGEAGELQTGLDGIGSLSTGNAGNVQSGERGNTGGNVGGEAGGQHKDWGHSPVPTGGNAQSSRAAGLPRQGVMPGEEMGHLKRRQD